MKTLSSETKKLTTCLTNIFKFRFLKNGLHVSNIEVFLLENMPTKGRTQTMVAKKTA